MKYNKTTYLSLAQAGGFSVEDLVAENRTQRTELDWLVIFNALLFAFGASCLTSFIYATNIIPLFVFSVELADLSKIFGRNGRQTKSSPAEDAFRASMQNCCFD